MKSEKDLSLQCLDCLTLKIKELRHFQTSLNTDQSIRCNVTESFNYQPSYYLQILTVLTIGTGLLLCISFLIISYMFRLNCHRQGDNTYIAKTYSDKTVLQCLCNVQIIIFTSQHQNPYASDSC
jgi:hypothetical protein